MSWTTGESEFDFWQRLEFTSCAQRPDRLCSRHSLLRSAHRTVAVSLGVERLEREADHSSASSKDKVVPMLNELSTAACRRVGSEGTAPPFLTQTLDGGEWSDSRPGRFTPGTDPSLPIG
jgi:hypothetical protein